MTQGFVLGPALFSLFINDLLAFLSSWVSCYLYSDDLGIWPSSPSAPIAVKATQEALTRLKSWSEDRCFPVNPNFFFSMDLHQANFYPYLLLVNSPLRFNPILTFLGITFNRTLSFSKHVSSLKAKFFPGLKALRCISASLWSPFKKFLSLL